MAIDDAEKRQNITGCGRPYMRSHFPQSAPDEEWRIAGGHAYSGNTLGTPPPFSYFRSTRSGSRWRRSSDNP